MKILRLLRPLCLCLALAVSLGACDPGGGDTEVESGGGAEADSEGLPTVTILADDRSADQLAAVGEAIERELGIATEIITRPGSTEGEAMVETMLATGEMADLFVYHTGSLFHALNPEDTVLDITDEAFTADLTREYREASSLDGKSYGIPVSTTFSYVWAYNKDVYAQLGLDTPSTWDMLMENCGVIADAGKTPVLASYGGGNIFSAQLVLLSDYYNLKSAVPDFAGAYSANRAKYATTPAALRGFEKLADLGEYLNDDFLEADNDDMLDRLVRGDGVHFPMNSGYLNAIQERYPEQIDSIGIFGQPGDDPDDQGMTLWMPYSLYIYKHSPNVEPAKEWLAYFVSQKGYDAYASVTPPSGPYAVEGIQLPETAPRGIREIEAYVTAGKATTALEFETPLKGPNCAKICFETILGVMDPPEAAAAYDQDLEVVAIQQQLPGW